MDYIGITIIIVGMIIFFFARINPKGKSASIIKGAEDVTVRWKKPLFFAAKIVVLILLAAGILLHLSCAIEHVKCPDLQ